MRDGEDMAVGTQVDMVAAGTGVLDLSKGAGMVSSMGTGQAA